MKVAGPIRRARANRSKAVAVMASVVAAVTLAGCGPEPTPETTTVEPPAAAVQAERHPAAALGALSIHTPQAVILPVSGAIYLSIENLGETDDHLLGASSPAASAVEIHESFEQDGVMRMQAHPDGFALPAGEALELKPGGKHLMLVAPRDLPPDPAEGGRVELTLHFAEAGDLVLQVPVVDPTAVLAARGASP